MNPKCPKNPQRRWIFSWLGYHKVRITRLSVFGASSWAAWNVDGECELCGCRFHRIGVDESELVLRGITPKAGPVPAGSVQGYGI